MDMLENLKQKYIELGEEIERLELDRELYTLHLHTFANKLGIGFKITKDTKLNLGYIDPNGKCYLLNTYSTVDNYEEWRIRGMKIDNTPIQWRGRMYKLESYSCLISFPIDGSVRNSTTIYDFNHCFAFSGCSDPNIIRFKHNNRPVLF